MEDDECRSNFVFQQIGNLLSSSHELSFNILRNLCYKDLISASQVCQTWFRISQSIINKERRLRFFVFHPHCFPTTLTKGSKKKKRPDPKRVFEAFLEQEKFTSMDGCLVFANGEWLYREDINADEGCKGSNLLSVMTRLLTPSCQLGLVCAGGVIGSSEHLQPVTLENKPSISSSNRNVTREEEQNTSQVGCRVFSDSRNGSGSETGNEESTSDSNFVLKQSVGYSLEIEEEVVPDLTEDEVACVDSISIILFPRQPGVKLNIAFIEKDKIYKHFLPCKQKGSITDSEFNSICNLSAEDDLKAFILLYDEHTSFVEALGYAAVSRQDGDIAFGGGLMRAVQQKGECLNGVLAVSFSGCNVKANSILIPPNVKSANLLEHYLNKLKKDHTPNSQSICFLFACCGRGQLWYQRNKDGSKGQFSNFEARTFRKLFPDVPLMGSFVEGEAGRNYIPTYDSTDETPRKRIKRQLFHQFTSIFVLVSIL